MDIVYTMYVYYTYILSMRIHKIIDILIESKDILFGNYEQINYRYTTEYNLNIEKLWIYITICNI